MCSPSPQAALGYSHLPGSFQNQPRLLKYCLHMVKWNMRWLYFDNDPLLLSGSVLVQSWFCPCEPETSLIPTNNHPVVVFWCIFSNFCGLYLKHTSDCTPLELPLLFIGVSNLQLRLQFCLWNLFTSVLHASRIDSPSKLNKAFFLEGAVTSWVRADLGFLPVATSPGERWCPPMTCHPEQDDGWIPPWRAQHLLKDVFQNPQAEIFSKGNPF